MIKLDLGCGNNVREGYKGVDIAEINDNLVVDLMGVWPWETNAIDALSSSHFIEHIPMNEIKGKDALFYFFDQAYRIIKPGGTFELFWPALQSVRAFQDPTHRRFIPIETMYYLDRTKREEMRIDHYNVNCDWELITAEFICNEQSMEAEKITKTQLPMLWNVMMDTKCTLRARKSVII